MGSYSENSETCSENTTLCEIEGGEVSVLPFPFAWELERDLILLLYEERDSAVRDAICRVLRRIEERRRASHETTTEKGRSLGFRLSHPAHCRRDPFCTACESRLDVAGGNSVKSRDPPGRR